jgi:MFS family permease
VRLYPWHVAAHNAYAWMPVFFLYFSEHLSLDQVLRLEAIYYAAVVLLEVPSGYFSDRVGRRTTLLVSAVCLTIAYTLFIVDTTFGVFVAAQIFLAGGIAFNSGTDTSFHYDSLASLGRENEYAKREAVAARNGLMASGAAALAGGAAGLIALKNAYAVSLVAALVGVWVVLRFVEPPTHEKDSEPGLGLVRQIGSCLGLLRGGALAWLFGFAVLMTVLNHVPYEFYQPYIRLALEGENVWEGTTPLVAGCHMAVAMLIGSAAAAHSIRLRDRVGTGPTLLLACAVQTGVIGVMGYVLSPWIIPLILLRVMPRAMSAAPLNAAITPRVPRGQRATYLSIQSLAGRLAFSSTLVGLSFLASGVEGGGGEATWESLALILSRVLIIACVGLAVFGVTARGCLRRMDVAAEGA